jgi:L-ribulokinase
MEVSASPQTCALGAAIMGAVAAGKEKSGFGSVEEIQKIACRVKPEKFLPDPDEHKIYLRLYGLYRILHDAFGLKGRSPELYPVMKELLRIKAEV